MAASSRFGIEGGEHACEPEKFHPNLGRPAVDSLGPAWPDQPGKGGTCPGLASLAGRSPGASGPPLPPAGTGAAPSSLPGGRGGAGGGRTAGDPFGVGLGAASEALFGDRGAGTGLVSGPQVGGPGRWVFCRGLCPAHPGSVPPAGQLPHSEGAERPEAVGAKGPGPFVPGGDLPGPDGVPPAPGDAGPRGQEDPMGVRYLLGRHGCHLLPVHDSGKERLSGRRIRLSQPGLWGTVPVHAGAHPAHGVCGHYRPAVPGGLLQHRQPLAAGEDFGRGPASGRSHGGGDRRARGLSRPAPGPALYRAVRHSDGPDHGLGGPVLSHQPHPGPVSGGGL
ncbi:unknown [Firmicutes bacterium CAG:114]|nr:unknown [Firmicutes bacterium CAG:114]